MAKLILAFAMALTVFGTVAIPNTQAAPDDQVIVIEEAVPVPVLVDPYVAYYGAYATYAAAYAPRPFYHRNFGNYGFRNAGYFGGCRYHYWGRC